MFLGFQNTFLYNMTSAKISVLRTILRGIMKNNPEKGRLRHNPTYIYIMDQYRKNSITDEQYCREHAEMCYLAETYATYLNSLQK